MHMTSIAVVAAGAIVAFPLVFSGVEDLRDDTPPYMAALPLVIENGTVTQEHLVHGVPNMPAGWEARITGPDGAVLCEGKSRPRGASYHDRTPATFSFSDWTGDDCPEVPDGSVFWARWTYEINGVIQSTSSTATKMER